MIRWDDEKVECPRDGCEETRFSDIGMEYHVLRDHERRITQR